MRGITMQREVFVVEKERFDLSDEKIYHLQGTWPKEHTAAAELDGKSLEVNLKCPGTISGSGSGGCDPCSDGDCTSR